MSDRQARAAQTCVWPDFVLVQTVKWQQAGRTLGIRVCHLWGNCDRSPLCCLPTKWSIPLTSSVSTPPFVSAWRVCVVGALPSALGADPLLGDVSGGDGVQFLHPPSQSETTRAGTNPCDGRRIDGYSGVWASYSVTTLRHRPMLLPNLEGASPAKRGSDPERSTPACHV